MSERRTRAGIRGEAAAAPRGPDKRFGLGRRTRRGILIALAVIAALLLGLTGVVVYAALTLPNIDDIGKATGTIRIVDRHGTLIAEVGHDAQSRTSVSLDQVATVMQNATLAAEDRNFYSEGAFDFKRVLKAVVDDVILRRPAEGASTITQQLVKQAFFGQQASKDPLRKIREALLAQEIEGKWSKRQILEQYLNITYYGENAYGVENAAQRYFGKHARELNLAEAALLAGLPEAPSYNDPYNNPAAAYSRMHYVLSGLVSMGVVSQSQAAQVDPLVGGSAPSAEHAAQQQQNQQTIETDLLKGKATTSPAPHFVQYIEDQLQSEFSDDPGYLNGSLVVTTTLDLNLQRRAQQAVTQGVARLGRNANNGALLMIDARTGQILAMVGSANYADNGIAGKFNFTTQATRQPGSSFKPYVYGAGFSNGRLTPSTMLDDTRAESVQLGGVQDFDRNFLGRMTAARALLLSRNVATEQAMKMAGIQDVIAFAHSLGITTSLAPYISTAIGTSSVKMIDHASAYAAFANGGHKVTAYGILKVVDGNGNVLADHTQPPGEGDPMSSAQAWEVTKILRDYARTWHLPVKWDTAGKSGTTENFVDAWYMAYTPDWVVATWAGHTSGTTQAEVGMKEVFGVTMAQYITVPFINTLPKPAAFTPVNGVSTDCSAQDQSVINQSGCPSLTPSSTPTLTTPTPPTATPFPSPPTTRPTPTPSTPSPTPTSSFPTPSSSP